MTGRATRTGGTARSNGDTIPHLKTTRDQNHPRRSKNERNLVFIPLSHRIFRIKMTGGCFESARASFEEELRLTKGQAALDAYRERKRQSFNAYKKQRQLLIKKANEGTQA